MSGNPRWFSTEGFITAIGGIISLGLAVLAPLLVNTTSVETKLVLGLVSLLSAYLFTMDLAQRAGLRKAQAELTAQIRTSDEKRFGALPLQGLYLVPEIEQSIVELVDAAASARGKPMQFLANRTVEGIIRQTHSIIDNSRGKFTCADHPEEMRLLRLALADTRHSLRAVATLGLEAWRTARFQDYFDVFLDAVPRISQQRIFVVTEDELARPEMVALLELHRDANVETVAIDRRRIADHLLEPIVLFDDGLLLSHVSRHGPQIEVSFSDDTVRLAEAAAAFDELHRKAFHSHHPARLWPI